MAPQTTTRMTYDEFMALPGDSQHYELIEGELIVNPSPVPRHQRILRKIFFALGAHFETRGGGEVFCAPLDVVLSPEVVLQPDIFVLKSERLSMVGPENVQGPPHIVVEIISAGTRRRDEHVKRRLYESSGVDEYWIADPDDEVIRIYRRAGRTFVAAVEVSAEAGDTLLTPLLPGFVLNVRSVFAE